MDSSRIYISFGICGDSLMITMESPTKDMLIMIAEKACAADTSAYIKYKTTMDDNFQNEGEDLMGEKPPNEMDMGGMIEFTEEHPEFKVKHALGIFRKASQWKVIFMLRNMDFDQELRTFFIGLIKDPMDAFQHYIHDKDLTKEDDIELKKIFEGKLPTAEKELKDGIVNRAKVI